MSDNVCIEVYERGRLVEVRTGHNLWLEHGRSFLASLISLAAQDPDVPEHSYRVRYMGFGIGGKKATGAAFDPVLLASYPPGQDPAATAGNKYNHEFPLNPLITTLERPVRRSGNWNPYPGDPGDEWLLADVIVTHQALQEVTYRVTLDGGAGDFLYGPFTFMPLSEMALFSDEPAVDPETPYSPALAYFPFATILLTPTTTLVFSWTIRF